MFLLNYGLPWKEKSLIRPSELQRLREEAARQMRLEPEVDDIAVEVSQFPGGVVVLKLKATTVRGTRLDLSIRADQESRVVIPS